MTKIEADLLKVWQTFTPAGLTEAAYDAAPVSVLRTALRLLADGEPARQIVRALNRGAGHPQGWPWLRAREQAHTRAMRASVTHARRALRRDETAARWLRRAGLDTALAHVAAALLSETDPARLRRAFVGTLALFAVLDERQHRAALDPALRALPPETAAAVFRTSARTGAWYRAHHPPETLGHWLR